jgi:hypothetical protein
MSFIAPSITNPNPIPISVPIPESAPVSQYFSSPSDLKLWFVEIEFCEGELYWGNLKFRVLVFAHDLSSAMNKGRELLFRDIIKYRVELLYKRDFGEIMLDELNQHKPNPVDKPSRTLSSYNLVKRWLKITRMVKCWLVRIDVPFNYDPVRDKPIRYPIRV